MNRIAVLMIATCGLFLVPGSLHMIQAYDPATLVDSGAECDVSGSQWALHQFGGDPLDREGCQQYCRSMHGVDPYAIQWRYQRGSNGGLGYSYAICIQDCDRRYWKAWDEQMGKLGKENE
jgi:hypothetical protein